jgi:hypothetical protein
MAEKTRQPTIHTDPLRSFILWQLNSTVAFIEMRLPCRYPTLFNIPPFSMFHAEGWKERLLGAVVWCLQYMVLQKLLLYLMPLPPLATPPVEIADEEKGQLTEDDLSDWVIIEKANVEA